MLANNLCKKYLARNKIRIHPYELIRRLLNYAETCFAAALIKNLVTVFVNFTYLPIYLIQNLMIKK